MPTDRAVRADGSSRPVERPWSGAHREALWQIIDAGLCGVEPGDLISKAQAIDLLGRKS